MAKATTTTSTHSAFRGMSSGDLTAVRYMSDSGEVKQVRGKVHGFGTDDLGDFVIFRVYNPETGKNNKGAVVRADRVQAALDAERAAKPARGTATDKQIDYALALLGRTSDVEWANSDRGGTRKPTRDELLTWSKFQVSNLIDDLRWDAGDIL